MLKAGVTARLNELLKPIQDEFTSSKEWQETEAKAYPPPEVKKKPKKERNLGSRFPGNKPVEARPDGHVEGPGAAEASVSTDAAAAIEKLEVAQRDS